MVLLKEISEGIWGLAVGPNNTSEVTTDHPFRLTMAALEIDDGNQSTSNGITRVTIKSSTADKGPATDLILCNLHYPSCLQQPLDIEFYEGQTLTFGVKGSYKVHLTGYVLQPDAHEMCEEGHEHGIKGGNFFEAGDESSSDDDDDDDNDDDDDDDESDDDDDEEGTGDFHVARRQRLRDDEDQDLEADYEDGYVQGEDQLGSETSSSDSDNDEQPKAASSSNKNKKRQRSEANGHSNKQEPETKKVKKNKNNEQEVTKTNENQSKKAKKSAQQETAAPTSSEAPADDKKNTNSLQINDTRVGTGPEAKFGKNVAVYYSGRLKSNNKTFDSCVKGKPFRFRLGAGEVIRGWDEGVKGMRVGGKRTLTIPPALAYGNRKLPGIPANSTLVFDVELKNVL